MFNKKILSWDIILPLLLALFITLEFVVFTSDTYKYKRVEMVKFTNEFTQDSVEVRHLVIINDDGTLQVLNNVSKNIKAGERVIIRYNKSWLLGIKRIEGYPIMQE